MNYLDTSVIISYYLPEARSAQVNALLQKLPHVVISDFTTVEVASAIGIRVRSKLTSLHDGQLALSTFQGHVTAGLYQRVHVDPQHYAQAAAIVGSFQYAIRGPDAIHIAVALLNSYRLYTADNDMATCAEALSVATTRLP